MKLSNRSSEKRRIEEVTANILNPTRSSKKVSLDPSSTSGLVEETGSMKFSKSVWEEYGSRATGPTGTGN
jgi:hypothetical protein